MDDRSQIAWEMNYQDATARARDERKVLRVLAPIAFGASFAMVGVLVSAALELSHRWTVRLLFAFAGTVGPPVVARMISRNRHWGGTENSRDAD